MPESPEINVPLLRKTLEHITAHPEEWDQASWGVQRPCGAAYCLAGTAVMLNGHQIRWDGCAADFDGDDILGVAYRLENGYGIDYQARLDLGLNLDQASELFCGGNGLSDLWRIASECTDGAIEIPAELIND